MSILFLDIETLDHIKYDEDGYIDRFIKKKNEKARTKFFQPFLDINTAVPTMIGSAIAERGDEGWIINPISIITRDEPLVFLQAIRQIFDSVDYVTIVTFNGNKFDLPVLLRCLMRSEQQPLSIGIKEMSDIMRGYWRKSTDLMKIFCPTTNEWKSAKFIAESLGIKSKISSETEEGIKKALNNNEIVLPDWEMKLKDDVELLVEMYFKFTGEEYAYSKKV